MFLLVILRPMREMIKKSIIPILIGLIGFPLIIYNVIKTHNSSWDEEYQRKVCGIIKSIKPGGKGSYFITIENCERAVEELDFLGKGVILVGDSVSKKSRDDRYYIYRKINFTYKLIDTQSLRYRFGK